MMLNKVEPAGSFLLKESTVMNKTGAIARLEADSRGTHSPALISLQIRQK